MVTDAEKSANGEPLPQVYLDVCALSRPFDDQDEMRIRLETSAVDLILSYVRSGNLQLVVSPVHDVEIGAISYMEERRQLELMLEQIGVRPDFDLMSARQRAEALVAQGVGLADAAHLAFAEQIGADFVTCDDRLLRQCRRVGVKVWAGTPPAYCDKENLR
jgi:predicted nucleic acid-binding protein